MVRATRNRSGSGSDRNGDDHREHERERYDDPEEHGEIERRRFHGGLAPTPELYALAREQWYRLPGAFVRPATNTTGGDTGGGDTGAGDREPDQ
jgi:hypothetical protein